jgi:uncharacterized protein YdaL
LGYNLWQVGWPSWNDFLAKYGYQHWYVAGNEGSGATTASYRYVQYNGKELPKFAWWNETAATFVNDPYVNILYKTDATAYTTLATIVHSSTGDAQPWVVRSSNLTHVVEMPFTYIHERDRYLAIADMVHDFIGINHPTTRKALFRLEDVHPDVVPANIKVVREELNRGRARPWNIALVPYYKDPYGVYNGGVPESYTMNASAARAWRTQVNSSRTAGAQLVLHGYTHQADTMMNPYNAVSGDDFEFWNAVADSPMSQDSYSWYGGRLLSANALMSAQGWSAWAWETPHYRQSVPDYLYTSDFFTNTYQRIVYYPYEIELWGQTYTWNEIFQAPQSVQDWTNALVRPAGDRWGGQFFPYVINHDVYGQRIVPENLGNIEPAEFALGPQYVRVVTDIVAAASANLVNRCAFASVFYHPYLIEYPAIVDAGGRLNLRSMINQIEALGYTFVQASTLVPANGVQLPNSPAGTFTSPQGFGTASWPN